MADWFRNLISKCSTNIVASLSSNNSNSNNSSENRTSIGTSFSRHFNLPNRRIASVWTSLNTRSENVFRTLRRMDPQSDGSSSSASSGNGGTGATSTLSDLAASIVSLSTASTSSSQSSSEESSVLLTGLINEKLPSEALALVFDRLSLRDLMRVNLVCRLVWGGLI